MTSHEQAIDIQDQLFGENGIFKEVFKEEYDELRKLREA